MITTKVSENIEKHTFPILAKNIEHDFIVLFIKEKEGTVVHDPKNKWGIGHYATNWVMVNSPSVWKHFNKNEYVTLIQG